MAGKIFKTKDDNPFGVGKFGRNISIGTSLETVWITGGLFPWSTTWDLGASQCFVKSTSAADAEAGNGARTVKVFGLDSGGLIDSINVTLSGTNTVDIGTWSHINRVRVESVGVSSSNQGSIVALYGGTVTVSSISTNENQTEIAVYRVPSDMSGYIDSFWVNSAPGDTAEASLYVRESGGAFQLKHKANVASGSGIYHKFKDGTLQVSAGSDIDVRAVSGNASGAEVIAGFDISLWRF